MSPNQLEARLQKVIAGAIDDFPQSSPVDLVRWTRENHSDLIGQLERKWADDKLVSLYLTEMRRRRTASAHRQGIWSLSIPNQPPRKRKLARNHSTNPAIPVFGHPAQVRLPFSEQFEKIPFLPDSGTENARESRERDPFAECDTEGSQGASITDSW